MKYYLQVINVSQLFQKVVKWKKKIDFDEL